MSTKICGKCKEEKDLSSLSKRGTAYQSWCKSCSKIHKMGWLQDNRDRVKWNVLWSQYRLRPKDWGNLLIKQNFVCAVCKISIPTQVDHDHSCCNGPRSCGKCVRGLLCSACNVVLAQIEARNILSNIVSYLGVVD